MQCNAICAACRADLVANQGTKKVWHFSHKSLEKCSGSLETALHFAAKEIFTEIKSFVLPEKQLFYSNGRDSLSEFLVKPNTCIKIEKCTLEKSISDIKPDILIESKNHKLLIEIAVTHFIDNEKLDKIKKLQISCIEIDLSHLKEQVINKEILLTELQNTNNWIWIYNKKQDAFEKQLRNKVNEITQKKYIKENTLSNSI